MAYRIGSVSSLGRASKWNGSGRPRRSVERWSSEVQTDPVKHLRVNLSRNHPDKSASEIEHMLNIIVEQIERNQGNRLAAGQIDLLVANPSKTPDQVRAMMAPKNIKTTDAPRKRSSQEYRRNKHAPKY
jgi:hypothetical protein